MREAQAEETKSFSINASDQNRRLLETVGAAELQFQNLNTEESYNSQVTLAQSNYPLTLSSSSDETHAPLHLTGDNAAQQQPPPMEQTGERPSQQDIRQAWLTFEYGDDINFGTRHDEYRFIQDGRSIIIKRNHLFEEHCIQRLLDLRFGHSVCDNNSLYEGIPFEYWTHDLSYWLRVMQGGLRSLEDDGWRIETGHSFEIIAVKNLEAEFPSLILPSGTGWFWFELGAKVNGELFALMPLLINLLLGSGGKLNHHVVESLNDNGTVSVETEDGRILALPFERVQGIMHVLIDVFDRRELLKMKNNTGISVHAAQAMEMVKRSRVQWSGLGFHRSSNYRRNSRASRKLEMSKLQSC